MICKECGAYNPDHASFCKVCAASLKDAPIYEEPIAAPAADERAEEDTARPVRSFAKPPVWKPTANFDFEPRVRTRVPAASVEDDEQDEASYRRSAGAQQFQPVDVDGQEDEEEAPVRRFAPTEQRARIAEEDEEQSEGDGEVFVRRKPVKAVKPAPVYDEDEDEDEEDEEPVRRSASPAKPVKKPVRRDYDDEDDDEDDEDDEDETPVRRQAKPVKKSVRRDYDDDDEDDDDDDDDEDEAPVRRKAKPAKKPVRRDYDDDDEDDDDDDDDDEDEAPVRRKAKPAKKPVRRDYDDDEEYDDDDDDLPGRKGSGSGIFTALLIILLVLILAVVAIVTLANKMPSIGEKLPFLQIEACAGTEPVAADTPAEGEAAGTEGVTGGMAADPGLAEAVTTDAAYVEDSVNDKGVECVKFCVRVDAGETLTIDLPSQEDYTITNSEAMAIDYKIEVPKQAFNPNTPLDTSAYTVNPVVTLTGADGSSEALDLPFTINFPTISLAVTTPAYTGEPVMAAEGNVITIEGKVDTHTVSVSANGQPLSVYEDGYFKGDYTMQGEADETVVITATQDNCVSASTEIVVTPYVFVAQEMKVTITKSVDVLRANDKTGTVTLKGVAEPGATLVAASANEKVVCGSVDVDVSGNFIVNVQFNDGYYGIANITVSAVKEGFVDASDTCVVTRMFDDKSGMTKMKNYYEVPKHKKAADLLANPTDDGYYRITIRLDEVNEVNGYAICKVSILQSGEADVTAYVMNQSTKWKPNSSLIGKKYNIYSMLNGLYPDTENLYLIAFFSVAR